MSRLARVSGIPLLMFVTSAGAGLVLPGIVYPTLGGEGYDPHPLETLNKDRALDEQRRMVFLGVILTGTALSVTTGLWLRRNSRNVASA